MKRILALLLAVILTAALCACSPIVTIDETDATANPDELRANFDKAVAYVEANVDTSGMTPQIQDDDAGSLYHYWLDEDEAPELSFSGEFMVGGDNKIVVGETTVKQLRELDLDVVFDKEEADPEETVSGTLEKDGKYVSIVLEQNTGDKKVPIDDLAIAMFWGGVDDDFCLDFTYCGLDRTSTLKDYIDKIGVPNNTLQVSADSTNTTIELSYYRETKDGDEITSTVLSIYLVYDPAADTAVLGSMQYDVNTYTPEDFGE